MRKRFLLIVLSLFPIFIYGQDNDYKKIVDDYCKKAEKMDWKSSSTDELAVEISKLALQIQQSHQETIAQIKEKIKANDSTLTDKEIEKEFSKGLIVSLVDECDTYVQLTRNLLAPCPKDNKTLILITKQIDSIIDKNKNRPYPEQLEAADDQLFNLIMNNENQVNKDYKDGLADPEFSDDLGKYLLHKSIKYYKAYLVTESIKMFN